MSLLLLIPLSGVVYILFIFICFCIYFQPVLQIRCHSSVKSSQIALSTPDQVSLSSFQVTHSPQASLSLESGYPVWLPILSHAVTNTFVSEPRLPPLSLLDLHGAWHKPRI